MRYAKIERKIWHDEKFVNLSPSQQRLFLYLLTCPHGNLIGLFVLKEGYACQDLRCSVKSFRRDLTTICELMPVEYDPDTSVLWLQNHLEYNPLTSSKQQKGALGILAELPKSYLLKNMDGLIEGIPKGLLEGLSIGVSKGLSIPLCSTVTDSDSVTDSVTEAGTESESEKSDEAESRKLSRKEVIDEDLVTALQPEGRRILKQLQSLPGWTRNDPKDIESIKAWMRLYPKIDMIEQLVRLKMWLEDNHKLATNRSRISNWFGKAAERGKEWV